MTNIIFRYPRGAPIVLDYVIEDDGNLDPTQIEVVAHLKVASGGAPPRENSPVVAEFTATFEPANGAEPAFWRATVAAEISRNLDARDYVTDAEFVLDGSTVAVSRAALIRIGQSVTPEASG